MGESTVKRQEPPDLAPDIGGALGRCMIRAPTKLRIADPVNTHGWPPPAARGTGGQGGALGRARGSCKFQLWSKWVNEFLCRIQGTYASPSTKFAHGLVHPEKWTWRAFPSITLTQTGQRRFVGGYALSPKEEGWAGPEAPGGESETWQCHRLWAWASPFSSLGLSLLLCEMGCTISCGWCNSIP